MKRITTVITTIAATVIAAATMFAGASTAMAADTADPGYPEISNVKVSDVGAHTANVSFDYDLTPLGQSVISNIKNVCFVVDVQRFTDITLISDPTWGQGANKMTYACTGGTDDGDLTQDTYNSIYGVHQDATYHADEKGNAKVKATGQDYYRYDNDIWNGKAKGTVTVPVIGLTQNALYGNKNRCFDLCGGSLQKGSLQSYANVDSYAYGLWQKGARGKTKVDVREMFADVRFEWKDASKPNIAYYGTVGGGNNAQPIPDFTTVSESAAKSESQLPSDDQGELTVPDGSVKAKSVARVYVENLSAVAKAKADANDLFWYSYIYSDAKQLTGPNGSPYVSVQKDDDGKYYFDAYIPEGYSGEHTISLQDADGTVHAWTKVNVNGTAATVDKTALNTAIANAGKLNQNDYTSDSWKTFAAALVIAKSVAANTAATQSQVDAAAKALTTAQAGLKKASSTVDKSALTTAVSAAGKLTESGYTTATWSTFAKALASAKSVAAKSDATQSQVDAAAKALTTAQAGLKKTSTKTSASSSGSLAQTGANVTAIAVTTTLMMLIAGAVLVLRRVYR
jgi:hypothetical protein